ncbi:adenine phosphoribosyltransferase [Candidatus Woesearchaeota archaeon]|nr:adenine phosphoribosyltransferase [Candidatus Woesearchaeota archaeon]|tara:strand:+ start:4860 stop:5402 length:543 start_codon:yes stop_codon:yes gene_type:complete
MNIDEDFLKSKIRDVPDFPKKGIIFKDITPLLLDHEAFSYAIQQILDKVKDKKIDVVASAESRGFILGAVLAYELKAGFVPLRKPGKLPYKTIKQEFQTEYSTDTFEVHEDAIKKGQNVLIVDDLIATAGTMVAAINLVKKLGGKVTECIVIIELPDLHGREKIENEECELFSLIQFEGD